MKKTLSLALAVLLVLGAGTLIAADLDRGSESATPAAPADPSREVDCYTFGGTEQSFTGADRGRGNTYTVAADEVLVSFSMELGFTGTVDLWFYVLESATLDGTYSALVEQVVTTEGTGQAFYESDPINVTLQAGMYYGIGVAWQSAEVTYLRDTASLPRTWELGTVEDAMQISAPPPYAPMTYNHFTGAEYSMELCFQGPIAAAPSSWSTIKALYR